MAGSGIGGSGAQRALRAVALGLVDRASPHPQHHVAGVLLSAVVVLVLVPRSQQQDIKVTNCKERDTPAFAESDDEFAKLPLHVTSTAGVWCKREDRHGALQSVAESKQAGFVGCVAGQFPLDDVFLKALNVLLERDAGDKPVPLTHPAPRVFLPDTTASRMRCCAARARLCISARKSSAVIKPTPWSAACNAFLARATAAFCSARNSASWQTAFSMNWVSDSPSRNAASTLALVSGVTRMGGKVVERLIGALYSK